MITDFGRTGNLVEWRSCARRRKTRRRKRRARRSCWRSSRAYFALLRAQAVLQVANQTVDARQLVVGPGDRAGREQTEIDPGCELRQRESGRCEAAACRRRKTI